MPKPSRSLTAPATPVPVVLPPGKPIDAFILIHQLVQLLATFLATARPIHPQPSGRGILQKNLMFRYSSEANIIVACARELVSKYTSNIDLGQPCSRYPTTTAPASIWNLTTSFPGFIRVYSLTRGDSISLYGKPYACKFQTPAGRQPETREDRMGRSQFNHPPAKLGLSYAEHQRISSALCHQYAQWNNAIDSLAENFNPLTPLGAVALMADTALILRTASLAAIKLVEHDLRIALGLRPIIGTLEAKLVYMAIVKEAGERGNLQAQVRREMREACKNGEREWDELVRREFKERAGGGVRRPEQLMRLH